MEVILKFNLPEEKHEFDVANKGMDMSIVLQEFDQYLRSKLKYEELEDKVYDVLQETRDKLWDMCNEANVNFL